ncbi:MAG: carboxypeptidase M32, partial [Verrucomicrobiota bacterium]
MSPYDQLVELSREVQLVGDVGALLSWDQEVLLPKNGVEYRARQMAWFSGWSHDRFTAPEVGDWIAEAESHDVDDSEIVRANLREWRHEYDRARSLPRKLVEDFAQAQVHAQSAWAEAREKSDFAIFAPFLERLIELCREQAELWGYEDEVYDALVDKFERGTSTAKL